MKYLFSNLKTYATLSTKWLQFCLLFCITLSLPILAEEKPAADKGVSLQADIEELDRRFKQLSAKIYSDSAKKNTQQSFRFSELLELKKSVQQAIDQNDAFSAITQIHLNLQLIEDNISDPITIELIELLLKHNEYLTAQTIFQQLKDDNDELLIARASLRLATYHSKREEWQNVIILLNIELDELSGDDFNRVNLLTGTALQHLRYHRKAIKIYQQISNTSADYPLAQLNIAVAHIRQDWWTDAHIVINQLLKNEQVLKNPELENRLYLMLGYSLLSKEFVREARESFRNVSIDSQYTNKALMGISLAAISQNDYSGAINALSILKQKPLNPLVSEEANLLLPHVYKMLEQYQTANTGYTNAIDYYQSRIDQLSRAITTDKLYTIKNISLDNDSSFVIADSTFNINNYYPTHFIENYVELKKLTEQKITPQLNLEASNLFQDYANRVDRIVKALVKNRIKQLESYLSQSRYSLAKLYDNNDE